MMVTTHAFVGLALAAGVAVVAPEFGVAAAVGAMTGGIFPDLDVAAAHRKTLHFPVYYSVVAVPASVVAVLAPSVLTVAVAMFLVSAAVHSASDVLGGDLELRPWEATGDRGVYVHPLRRWFAPRRLVRYDGAPEDFVVGTAFALPALVVFDGWVRQVAVAGLVVSLAYTLVRKRLPELAPEWLQ